MVQPHTAWRSIIPTIDEVIMILKFADMIGIVLVDTVWLLLAVVVGIPLVDLGTVWLLLDSV